MFTLDPDAVRRAVLDQPIDNEELPLFWESYMESLEATGKLKSYFFVCAKQVATGFADDEDEFDLYFDCFERAGHLLLVALWFQLGGRLPMLTEEAFDTVLDAYGEGEQNGSRQSADCPSATYEGLLWLFRADESGLLLKEILRWFEELPNVRDALLVLAQLCRMLMSGLDADQQREQSDPEPQ